MYKLLNFRKKLMSGLKGCVSKCFLEIFVKKESLICQWRLTLITKHRQRCSTAKACSFSYAAGSSSSLTGYRRQSWGRCPPRERLTCMMTARNRRGRRSPKQTTTPASRTPRRKAKPHMKTMWVVRSCAQALCEPGTLMRVDVLDGTSERRRCCLDELEKPGASVARQLGQQTCAEVAPGAHPRDTLTQRLGWAWLLRTAEARPTQIIHGLHQNSAWQARSEGSACG